MNGGFSAADRKLGVDQQKLWLCRWGTMTALVWAMTAENAEQRVRHDAFDRRWSLGQVMARPVVRHEQMVVTEATEEDRELFLECGVEVPA